MAVPLTLHEQEWLPVLAPRLPLPVPTPVRVGVASPRFAWPWSVVTWIEGVPGDRATLADAHESARRLGRFLRALHEPAPLDAPRNDARGVPIMQRSVAFEDRITTVADEVDAVRAVWEGACEAPRWAAPGVWLHGDLHPANLLVCDGLLTGVIDFGDICAGDPATDLAAAWMLLPITSLAAFVHAYGSVDRALISRARGWAVLFGLVLLDIGLVDKPSYEPVARATLDRVTSPAR